jgi:hypothetical protein
MAKCCVSCANPRRDIVAVTFITGTTDVAWNNGSFKMITPSELIGRFVQRWRIKSVSYGVTGPRICVVRLGNMPTQSYSVDLRFNGANGLPGQTTANDVLMLVQASGGYPPTPSIWFGGEQVAMLPNYPIYLTADAVSATYGATTQPCYIDNTTNQICIIEFEFVTTDNRVKDSAYEGNSLRKLDAADSDSDDE